MKVERHRNADQQIRETREDDPEHLEERVAMRGEELDVVVLVDLGAVRERKAIRQRSVSDREREEEGETASSLCWELKEKGCHGASEGERESDGDSFGSCEACSWYADFSPMESSSEEEGAGRRQRERETTSRGQLVSFDFGRRNQVVQTHRTRRKV